MQWGGKSGTRKAGIPDSLQSENPGTREKRNQKGKRREQSTRTSQRTKERKREQIKKRGGGERRW